MLERESSEDPSLFALVSGVTVPQSTQMNHFDAGPFVQTHLTLFTMFWMKRSASKHFDSRPSTLASFGVFWRPRATEGAHAAVPRPGAQIGRAASRPRPPWTCSTRGSLDAHETAVIISSMSLMDGRPRRPSRVRGGVHRDHGAPMDAVTNAASSNIGFHVPLARQPRAARRLKTHVDCA